MEISRRDLVSLLVIAVVNLLKTKTGRMSSLQRPRRPTQRCRLTWVQIYWSNATQT